MNAVERVGAVVLALVAVSACADRLDRWENPSVSQGSWEVHKAECQRLAVSQAEDDYAIGQSGVAERFGRETTLRNDMARFDARLRRDDLFERCMKDRGYRQTERKTAPKEPGESGRAP